MIRTIRPTDLVALVAFEGKAFPNEARTRDRLQKDPARPLAMGTILEQWITLENRHTLVATEGHSIKGLVSVRHRAGRSAWEVDWLLLGQDDGADQISQELLEYLAEVGVTTGVQRIFLRLPQRSLLIAAARRAGFWPYVSEALYRTELSGNIEQPPEVEGVRPRLKGDEHGIFRLYQSSVPQAVRTIEGMTLQQWAETQDASFGRQREYVCVREDQWRAWLRVTKGGGCGQFQLLVDPKNEDVLAQLVPFALCRLGKPGNVLALVPDFQSSLQSVLVADWGFEEMAQYYTMVRQLAVPVREGRLVLAGA